ncbi:hypothetical protein [Halobacillus mangrovi]|uniref:Uncharacterized protein n=1 Tax=Halobacillus mangrovi TaxID=402384 RepID=A0A1W5ZSF8_9BACI|nr:hypothetical protein [Halobacillus mangrovi]ARI76219.1 hypothetical protein HM131_04935 [Halobacillus mangrovi]
MRKFFTRLVLAGILFIGVQSLTPLAGEEQHNSSVTNPSSVELSIGGLNLAKDPGDGGIG